MSLSPLFVLFIVLFIILSGIALTIVAIYPTWQQLTVWNIVLIFLGAGIAFCPLSLLFLNFRYILSVTLITIEIWLIFSHLRQQKELRIIIPSKLRSYLKNWRYNVVLFSVFISLFLIRFYAIRSLPLPMWGDSVHHTLIVQLLLDNGGLFDSWQPYAEMESLTYHFGFHAIVAVFAMLSGLDAARATLIMGQFLNVFAVLSLAPLAWKISNGNRWATIVSWLFAGFISFMPMYYTN